MLAIKRIKIQILMNNPICLGLSILKIGKIIIYEFWCGYVKPKSKLCYMDTNYCKRYCKR